MLSQTWIKIIQVIEVLLIIFVLIVYYQTYVKKILQENKEADKKIKLGPNRISLRERIFQIFLIFVVAVYAIWSLGVSRLVKESQSIYSIVAVMIIGGLIVFGYYLLLLWENKRTLDAWLTEQSFKQRIYFYLKIIISIIVISLINFLIVSH
jgi:hypothetical protein